MDHLGKSVFEKVLTLGQGSVNGPLLPPGLAIPLVDGTDLMDILTGKNIEMMISKVDHIP